MVSVLLTLLACIPDDRGWPRYGGDDTSTDTSTDTGDTSDDTSGGWDTSQDCGACPCGMVGVGDPIAYCIDAYEADVDGNATGNADQGPDYPDGSTTGAAWPVAGVLPQVNVSWYQAYALCQNAGKHLCTPQEWADACDGLIGEGGSRFAWGESPEADEVCAAAHEDGTSDYTELSLTGSFPGCATPTGIYDQAGNAWEWVDLGEHDETGRPIAAKVGGAYYAGAGNTACDFVPMTEHPPEFEGTIGVRCCALPQ